MTFSNIEIPINSYNNRGGNWTIYDGTNVALLHDGTYRYLYLKSQNTAVRLSETGATSPDNAFILGNNASNIYLANPATQQLRSISTSGLTINEAVYNLNDFNKLKDYSIVGVNTTQNTFIPTCGTVVNNRIVVGGYLHTPSVGLQIDGNIVASESICYMYSEDNGSTWIGPVFPFIDTIGNIQTGRVYNVKLINDNWIFYVGVAGLGANLNLVQSLGVDFIGNPLFSTYLESGTFSLNNYQLPMVFFDDKIYYLNTLRDGYYVYNFETDLNSSISQSNITNIAIVSGFLYISLSDSCDPIIISPENTSAANTITSFALDGDEYYININLGQTFIEETTENNTSEQFTDSPTNPINSSHFLQPASLILQP